MKPDFVAKKSAWAAWSPSATLLTILFLPLFGISIIVQIFRTITVKTYTVEFYKDRIIVKSGWLNTQSKQMIFMGVTSVSVSQSLWGNLFNYGKVNIQCVGPWDVDTSNIKDPKALEAYLQTRTAQTSMANQYVQM